MTKSKVKTGELKGTHLKKNLDRDKKSAGIFGICYSVLTWSGVGKGLSLWPSSWKKSVTKLFEDGHATTFLLTDSSLTMTGMSKDEKGWVFDTDSLASQSWARTTGSTYTYVYYVNVTEKFIEKYGKVKAELEKAKTSYAVLWPNLPMIGRYENCVSHSHYLMYKLGLAYWTSTKGWWVPSHSNWVDWFKSFIPTAHDGYSWKYKRFANTNTHIP